MKRVLMVAYHYPPVRGSSGLQRTLNFSRYLLEHDWHPIVLTVTPMAYEHIGQDQVSAIPEEVTVLRAWALDTARHLAIGGRYPGFLARPDRWASWALSGAIVGRRALRRYAPRLIWSTYPIATAHQIGAGLHRASGLPWVADFRDMMVEGDYPSDPAIRARFEAIEGQAAREASRVVVTTPGTRALYADRYTDQPDGKWALIRNGYDESDFAGAEAAPASKGGPVTLIHSGILYPAERDPTAFFEALAELKVSGDLNAGRLQVVLRATGHDDHHRQLIRRAGIEDLVRLEPPVAYAQALGEMLGADGLLLFQAANCNLQIPAKLYEYFRAGRPVLALTDPAGDTATTMTDAGLADIVPLDDAQAIKTGLMRFVEGIERGELRGAEPEQAARYSRRSQAGELAALFDEVLATEARA